jgi:cytochrome c556
MRTLLIRLSGSALRSRFSRKVCPFRPYLTFHREEIRKMKSAAIAGMLLAATAMPAATQQVKPENQVKYRKAAYTLMNLNFGSLDQMAQGKKPFNKSDAQRSADLVAILSPIPKDYFGEGTEKDTRAKPEVWTKRADFDAKMDQMVAEAQKLPAAVRSGDMNAFRKQVAEVGNACDACHDDYRAKSK